MGIEKGYGIVLGGGGFKGSYEIGVLAALKELGFLDNVLGVAGTSIGGINLGLLIGATMDKAKEAWCSFAPKEFYEFDNNGFDITKEGDGILSRSELEKLLDKYIAFENITDANIPLYVTACYMDENHARQHTYFELNGNSTSQIKEKLFATSAIAVAYDAVMIDGINYFDGGYRDNHPIKPLYDKQIRDIIVISCDYSYKTDRSSFPGCNVFDFVPSTNLDINGISGTFDTNLNHAIFRYELGYLDGMNSAKSIMTGEPVGDLAANAKLAASVMKKEGLLKKTNEDIGKMNDLLGKYGIKL